MPPNKKFCHISPAVVAEWLRRLTRNQFPSGSAGSNPADCENFFKQKLHRPGIEPGPPAWQASILPLNQRCWCGKASQSQHTVLPEPTHPAVVAEWLRRLTRNEFPSGSVGSNPTNCDAKRQFWHDPSKRTCSRWGSNSQPRHIFCTVYKYRALTDCATGANH